mmetsp:Transcript_26697/g.48397  ORF Transcript_26697/g.48397 Transcript_26697/m.48397 type:complete len:479 (+) Transcript_26697:2044-3480(+)
MPRMVPPRESLEDVLVPPVKVVTLVILLDLHLLLRSRIYLPLIHKSLKFRRQRLLPKHSLVIRILGGMIANPPLHHPQVIPRRDPRKIIRGMLQHDELPRVRSVPVTAPQSIPHLLRQVGRPPRESSPAVLLLVLAIHVPHAGTRHHEHPPAAHPNLECHFGILAAPDVQSLVVPSQPPELVGAYGEEGAGSERRLIRFARVRDLGGVLHFLAFRQFLLREPRIVDGFRVVSESIGLIPEPELVVDDPVLQRPHAGSVILRSQIVDDIDGLHGDGMRIFDDGRRQMVVPRRTRHFHVRIDEHEHLPPGDPRSRQTGPRAPLPIVVLDHLHLGTQGFYVVPFALVYVLANVGGKIVVARDAVVVHDDHVHQQCRGSARQYRLHRKAHPIVRFVLRRHDDADRGHGGFVEAVMATHGIVEVFDSDALVDDTSGAEVAQVFVLLPFRGGEVYSLEGVVGIALHVPGRSWWRLAVPWSFVVR